MHHHPLVGDYPPDPRFGWSAKAVIVLISFLNCQFLFVKSANPFGVHYVQELYLLALLAYVPVYVLRKSAVISRMDGFVLLYATLFTGLSAVFALLEYGQPLFYGILEARVTLMTLAYFPLKDLVRGRKKRLVYALNTTVFILFLVALLGLLVKLGLFSIAGYYRFGTSDLAARGDIYSADTLRGDRMATGRFIVIFSTIYALTMVTQSASHAWKFVAFVALWHIVFVLQERQTMVGVSVSLTYLVLSGFHLRRIRKGSVAIVIAGVGAILFAYLSSDLLLAQSRLLDNTLNADFYALARVDTALSIFEQMNLTFGHGALSLLWQDGFHRIFSERFFLGDVGIIGTAFRLGAIPALLLIGNAAAFLVLRTLHLPEAGLRKLVWALLAYLAITAITSAPFEYVGNYLALVFLILDRSPSQTARLELATSEQWAAVRRAPLNWNQTENRLDP
ncbi:hypothetical protein [Pontibaca salina]|uniref:Uncharacterized protein n=1 Tax=Pontibaca salina TaxID=2795731 RepID=A0A934HUF6_9RHOB|nr:hypothetical protein [Pontibaca salina]MBI6630995.1 hypothetical protein [Pontibaca salina]